MELKKGIIQFGRALNCERAKAAVIDPTEQDTHGSIEGYVAAFGNVDSQRDRILMGAFAKTIQERIPAGKVPLMSRHFAYGGDADEAIGLITEAIEDEYGLWIHAKMSATSHAQDIRTKIQEGIIWGMSIGYEIVRYEEERDDAGNVIWNLKELKLLEGTVTTHPANELAVITAAKTLRRDLPADMAIDGPLSREKVIQLRNHLDTFLDIVPTIDGVKTDIIATMDRYLDSASCTISLLSLEH